MSITGGPVCWRDPFYVSSSVLFHLELSLLIVTHMRESLNLRVNVGYAPAISSVKRLKMVLAVGRVEQDRNTYLHITGKSY
jgi:hypothetical protein